MIKFNIVQGNEQKDAPTLDVRLTEYGTSIALEARGTDGDWRTIVLLGSYGALRRPGFINADQFPMLQIEDSRIMTD